MALAQEPKLVLFDIDGTLLSIAEHEMNVFGDALERVFGTAGSVDTYNFAGKTDHQIAVELLSSAGLTSTDIESGFVNLKDCYFGLLAEMLGNSGMAVLPGVVELLEELAKEPSVVVGLQTGNWEVAAEIKLARFDLARYFAVGAFGDGHLDRNGLPPVARRRAEERIGSDVRSDRTVIIGDTALDIACAQKWEMASVGVATGSTSRSELHAAGASLVVPTLEELDIDGLLALLASEPQ